MLIINDKKVNGFKSLSLTEEAVKRLSGLKLYTKTESSLLNHLSSIGGIANFDPKKQSEIEERFDQNKKMIDQSMIEKHPTIPGVFVMFR